VPGSHKNKMRDERKKSKIHSEISLLLMLNNYIIKVAAVTKVDGLLS
jgi:hypothetical protein